MARHLFSDDYVDLAVTVAYQRGTARTDAQNGDEWIVEHRAFRAWVKDNIAEYAKHSRKADQMWLLETLTGVTA